jgi:hypothetical protein
MWNPSGGGSGRVVVAQQQEAASWLMARESRFGVNPPSLARLLAIELVCKGSSSLNRPPVIAPTFRLQIFLSIKNR